MDRDAEAMRERLLQSFEMWEDGVQIKRESLQRQFPDASDQEIDAALDRWLGEPDRLDPEWTVIAWPRRPR